MLHGLPITNWFLEYRRMGLVNHHETSISLSFARVMFEFVHDGVTLPCNALFKRALTKYKGIYFIRKVSPILYFQYRSGPNRIFSIGTHCQSFVILCWTHSKWPDFYLHGSYRWRLQLWVWLMSILLQSKDSSLHRDHERVSWFESPADWKLATSMGSFVGGTFDIALLLPFDWKWWFRSSSRAHFCFVPSIWLSSYGAALWTIIVFLSVWNCYESGFG